MIFFPHIKKKMPLDLLSPRRMEARASGRGGGVVSTKRDLSVKEGGVRARRGEGGSESGKAVDCETWPAFFERVLTNHKHKAGICIAFLIN